MKIAINDDRKIFEIQEEFNSVFPYLKLEFYPKSDRSNGASLWKFLKRNKKTLGECRTKHKDGAFNIIPEMTVMELEKRFSDIYGLVVQIFRQSGTVWLEATVTDGWTLEEQNKQGESLSKKV